MPLVENFLPQTAHLCFALNTERARVFGPTCSTFTFLCCLALGTFFVAVVVAVVVVVGVDVLVAFGDSDGSSTGSFAIFSGFVSVSGGVVDVDVTGSSCGVVVVTIDSLGDGSESVISMICVLGGNGGISAAFFGDCDAAVGWIGAGGGGDDCCGCSVFCCSICTSVVCFEFDFCLASEAFCACDELFE